MNFIKKIACVLAGLLCLARTIVYIKESVLCGILLIFAGLICTPLYGILLDKYTKPDEKKRSILRTVVFVILFVTASMIAPTNMKTVDEPAEIAVEETQEEQTYKKPENETDGIDKEYLGEVKEYDYMEVLKNSKKYRGEATVFEGTVTEIQVQGDDYGMVAMMIEDSKSEEPVFVILKSVNRKNDPYAVEKFYEGDIVTVYGDFGINYEDDKTDKSVLSVNAKYIRLK